MAWFYLVIASFGEIFGVLSIHLYLQTKKMVWMCVLICSFAFGFFFLSIAVEVIPLGTAYAIWSGLGATGAVLIGIFFFKESSSWIRILCLFSIITGAVGLKLFGGV